MRVFRMFGMFLMATFLCVNLSSCSEDDDEEGGGVVDTAGLEGTWEFVNDQGYKIIDGKKQEWDVSYNPINPVEEEVAGVYIRMLIAKTGEKTYTIKYYGFSGGSWTHAEDDNSSMSVEGSVMTITSPESDETTRFLFSLNDNQLVLEGLAKGVNYSVYQKMTFIRL